MSDDKLSTALQALRKSAAALNAASDIINTSLATVEAQLVEWQVGHEVWLENSPLSSVPAPSEDGDENPPRRVTQLGFAKVKDGWHIAVRDLLVHTVIDEDGEEDVHERILLEACAIAHASRQERIAALPHLLELVTALATATQDSLKTIEEAKNLILG